MMVKRRLGIFFISAALCYSLLLMPHNVSGSDMQVDLSLNDVDFIPGESIIIKPSIYNQEHQLIRGNISVSIIDSGSSIVFNQISESGKQLEYLLAAGAVPGYWQVIAEAHGLGVKRFLNIKEHAAIDVKVINDIVRVVNIGNILYEKPLEIRFADESGDGLYIKELDLGVGGKKEFRLSAPSGFYDVEVAGIMFNNVPLTGKITQVIELRKNKPGFLMQYPLVSFFIFILLLLLIILLSHGMRQGPLRFVARMPSKPRSVKSSSPSFLEGRHKTLMPVKKAQSSLVLKGTKQKVSVLCIKLKNMLELREKLSKIAFKELSSFVERTITRRIEDERGVINKTSDYEMLAIFSPTLKSFRHEIAAVKAGVAIEKELNEHNRKLKNKVDFGIGINSGELIINIQQIMLYTSVSRTIAIAKKIAEQAGREVLISKDIFLRVSPEIKAQKAYSFKLFGEDADAYSIKKIGDREYYKAYVRGVLERIQREEKRD